MTNKLRGVLTVVLLACVSVLNWVFNAAAPIISANLAGKQLESSDTAYAVSRFAPFFNGSGVPAMIVLLTIIAVWWQPLKDLFAARRAVGFAVFLGLMFFPNLSHAYYAKQDWPEVLMILPNESAFWIPNVGDTKNGQAQMQTEDFLKTAKVPGKLFTVPHVKWSGSGAFSDYYVASGKLILVDRTPYSREWVHDAARGSSAKDESFPCQSNDGLTIRVGVSIGTSVTEDQAARFLYNFGVNPPAGDRNTPEVMFGSLFQGRSLTQVMDEVGRRRVQTLVCGQLSKYKFDDANLHMADIENAAEKDAKAYLDSVGITLNFMGYADTWEFDGPVQDAINRRYAAAQDAEGAKILAPYADVIQKVSTAQAVRVFADKFNGKLPNALLLPPDVVSGMMGLQSVRPISAHVTDPSAK